MRSLDIVLEYREAIVRLFAVERLSATTGFMYSQDTVITFRSEHSWFMI